MLLSEEEEGELAAVLAVRVDGRVFRNALSLRNRSSYEERRSTTTQRRVSRGGREECE